METAVLEASVQSPCVGIEDGFDRIIALTFASPSYHGR
jgi:hypothetical protein